LPKRKPQQRDKLSRERILAVALGLVDREGLEAVSMRRVGDELGVEAMSLYHHVANKAALLDGVFEAVLAELSPPVRRRAWADALRERARAFRLVLRAHPHALPLFATRPAVTPAAIAHVEGVLAVLREAGFSVAEALGALQVLSAFVVGHTLAAYAPQAELASHPDYSKLDERRFARVREAARLLPERDVEREFEWGLELMLSGLAARLVG